MQTIENRFLTLINACISHELRNPLNSVIAQNMEQKALLNTLREMLQDEFGHLMTESTRRKINETIDELDNGCKIQSCSAELMTFVIQDFLDYS